MRSPIGHYLEEFRRAGAPRVADDASVAHAVDLLFEAGEHDAPDLDLPLPDLDQSEPEPFAEAFDQALPECAPDPLHDAAIVALEAEHAAALVQARQQWAENEGATLAALIAAGFADLERTFAETLVPLLEPFLAKAAQLKTVDQLRDAIGTLLASGDGGVITVTGPDDLVSAIQENYAGHPTLVFQTADMPDVSVVAGGTRIQSQLRSWACALDAALGADA